MNFTNYNDYAILNNLYTPENKIKYFQVSTLNLDTLVKLTDFEIKHLTGFTLKYNCYLLNSININKGRNLNNDVLLGYMNTIKINLKEFIEYSLNNNTVEMIFNEDSLATTITTELPLQNTDKINIFFNYIYISSNNKFLNLSIVYTIYIT